MAHRSERHLVRLRHRRNRRAVIIQEPSGKALQGSLEGNADGKVNRGTHRHPFREWHHGPASRVPDVGHRQVPRSFYRQLPQYLLHAGQAQQPDYLFLPALARY